jgi:hypothetical protein
MDARRVFKSKEMYEEIRVQNFRAKKEFLFIVKKNQDKKVNLNKIDLSTVRKFDYSKMKNNGNLTNI